MDYNADGIRQIAMINKNKLKQKYLKIPIAGAGIDYKFKISGVGARFIKIKKFFYYSDIIKSVSQGNKLGFEYAIEQIIVDPSKKIEPVLDNYSELRERALANKLNLKNQYINIFIGKKEYGFRIAGIGAKSIKIEMFIGYDEIVKELSSGNDISLEYILLQLMMGNEVDYSKFYQFFDEDELIFEEDGEEEIEVEEKDITNLEKLSEEEFNDKFDKVKGWQKLIFDSIEDILSDVFTLDELLSQNRILSYKTNDGEFENMVLDNLNQLIDIGLVSKVNKNSYVKLW